MASVLGLLVDGTEYRGWKTIRVSRALDALAGAYSLEITERTDHAAMAWPIQPGASCRVLIDGEPVITGFVDSGRLAFGESSHTVSVDGRDATADLVDCAAPDEPGEWSGLPLAEFCRRMAKPYGLDVVDQAGNAGSFSVLKIQTGESCFEAMERAARQCGVVLTSDGSGRLVIARPGQTSAVVALEEGKNVKGAEVTVDHKDRFSSYTVKGQAQGSNDGWGETVSGVRAVAKDSGVRRHRPLVLVAEQQATAGSAAKRAQWECAVRAGKSAAVSVAVQGWRQGPGGPLWTCGDLVNVKLPTLRLEETLVLGALEFRLSDRDGQISRLTLKRPDAYLPEPVKPAGKSGDVNPWAGVLEGR